MNLGGRAFRPGCHAQGRDQRCVFGGRSQRDARAIRQGQVGVRKNFELVFCAFSGLDTRRCRPSCRKKRAGEVGGRWIPVTPGSSPKARQAVARRPQPRRLLIQYRLVAQHGQHHGFGQHVHIVGRTQFVDFGDPGDEAQPGSRSADPAAGPILETVRSTTAIGPGSPRGIQVPSARKLVGLVDHDQAGSFRQDGFRGALSGQRPPVAACSARPGRPLFSAGARMASSMAGRSSSKSGRPAARRRNGRG